ncbi:MAG: sigma-70 family RNA polymerase sigma factor [Candidatus Binatia bacterium]
MASQPESRDHKREAFAREAMIHLDHLFRVAYHLARDPASVQDLVHDTFLRALDSYKLFNPPTNMRAWLTKILQNIFFDQYRKQKRWVDRAESPRDTAQLWNNGLSIESDPEGLLLKKELSSKINHHLKSIPDEYRLPMVLVDMSEFSYAEAAEILSCPVGTIRSRLSRGRKLLQGYLSGYVDPADGTKIDDLRGSRRTHHRPG